MINSNRLWGRLHELAEIGKDENGGVTRFSFTRENREAKDLIRSYMIKAGMDVKEDSIGNLIGKIAGSNPTAPSIIIGSHIDSVKQGGNFDGPLGVIGGIEVVQTMKEAEITPTHPIEVIAFTDEEGSRFNFGMIGSRAVAGTLTESDLSHADADGITIKEAMIEAGYQPDAISLAKRDPDSIKHYLELHIEQGKVLETENLSVGVVSGISGPLWMKVNIIGESGHAGATPMDMRFDPLVAFANIVQGINREVTKQELTVATIGKVDVKPGGVNIIPKEVEFTIDLRDIKEDVRNKVEEKIINCVEKVCEENQVTYEVSTLQRVAPLLCSDDLQAVIKKSCDKLNLKTMTLPSGAGHDGMQLKRVCSVGMIFVQSKDGISHNPLEYSSQTDCANGVNVLYETVQQLTT